MANITRVDPFDDIFRGFFVCPVDFNSAQSQAPSIKMDVKEEDDSYLVHAELPGVKEGDRILRSERYFGKVSRSFQVERDIDDSKAAAKFNDGILELTLPKRTASPNKRLNID